MEEHEQRDFDLRLNEAERAARPSQGVEQLWGVMGRPGAPRGAAPARPRAATKVGEN